MTRLLLLIAALAVAVGVGWAIFDAFGGGVDPGNGDSRSSESPDRPKPLDPPSARDDDDDDLSHGGSDSGGTEPRSAHVPDRPAPKLTEAKALFDLGEYDRALIALDRIIEEDPKNADALYWRGRTQNWLANPRAAEADLRASITAGGETAERLLWHAWSLHQIRRHEEAMKAARHALELDPQAARAHSVLASIHLFKGRKKEAEEEVRKALEIDPEEPMAISLSKRLK